MAIQVAVLGAGVIGLSTAYRLKLAHPQLAVTVIAEHYTPNTLSDGAAGYWEPYVAEQNAPSLVKSWAHRTYQHVLKEIRSNSDSAHDGLYTMNAFVLGDAVQELPYWTDGVLNLHVLSKADLESKFPPYIVWGFSFTTVFIEGAKYLPSLMNKFTKLGGLMLQKKISDIGELSGRYDIVVNCTGFGARDLLDDRDVVPVRGQVMRVRAPWIKSAYLLEMSGSDETTYILPNTDTVVVGGTRQRGDFNTKVEAVDKEWILQSSQRLIPSLKHAEHVSDWVGLRPARSMVRLEREEFPCKNGKKLKVVHNYGHGGMGLTVHWGCAEDAVKLVSEAVKELAGVSSKL